MVFQRTKPIRTKKQISIKVSDRHHDMLKRMAIDFGLSVTEIFTQYLEFLKKQHYLRRNPLGEFTETTFRLHAPGSGDVQSTDNAELE